MPKASNLNGLLARSRSSRVYFYSLPPETRRRLSVRGDYIRTADELHRNADFAERTSLWD